LITVKSIENTINNTLLTMLRFLIFSTTLNKTLRQEKLKYCINYFNRMSFSGRNTKKMSNRKQVTFIFFQIPSTSVLYRITEYLRINYFNNAGYFGKSKIPVTFKYLGRLTDLPDFIAKKRPEEFVIVGLPENGTISQELLITLKFSNAIIKLIPVDFDLLTGLIQVNDHKDLPHIRLFPDNPNQIDKFLKYITSKTTALAGLFITIALFPIIAIFIKTTSKGPIFYRQQRLGKNARPFIMYKFRTMYLNAEKNGPQLSHTKDHRITKAGKILRYWHIDELPQFWNILKGDMVLIGPRPERPFFAKALVKKVPYYNVIYQEKPGLTSLAMVKFGYASSINEITDRLYYDIVYLNNPSFLMDLKIIGCTIIYAILKLYLDPLNRRKEYGNPQIKDLPRSHIPFIRLFPTKWRYQKHY
jgi:lipopolysaccharide/colanic/teichoic acid biosynthesis glycosyltransferase